jgi:hypothetical protein
LKVGISEFKSLKQDELEEPEKQEIFNSFIER